MFDKFLGDAVLAIFALPVSHGDDPQRALSAALELREAVRNDAILWALTGDAVIMAARLQQTADPWDIVCGERTVRAAIGAFTFGPPQSQDAKGKSHPIPVRRLIARAEHAAPPRTALIGRDADLTQLELSARRASPTGRCAPSSSG